MSITTGHTMTHIGSLRASASPRGLVGADTRSVLQSPTPPSTPRGSHHHSLQVHRYAAYLAEASREFYLPGYRCEAMLSVLSFKEYDLIHPLHLVPIFPPASRLVGIELNPGPKSPAVAASAVATLTKVLTTAIKSARPALARRKVRRSAPRGRSVSGLQLQDPPIRSIAAPVAVGQVMRRVRQSNTVSLPFRCANVEITTSATGVLLLNTTGSFSAGGPELDLHPIANGTTGQSKMFGYAMSALAASFSRWRVKALRVTYHPVCTTSTAGVLRIAYSSESAINGAVNWNSISSSSTALTVTGWAPGSMDIPSDILLPNKDEWSYTYPPATPTTSDDRFSNQGCILAAIQGGANSVFWGELEFEGVIEFKDLFDEADL